MGGRRRQGRGLATGPGKNEPRRPGRSRKRGPWRQRVASVRSSLARPVRRRRQGMGRRVRLRDRPRLDPGAQAGFSASSATSGSCTGPIWSARRPANCCWSTSTPPTSGSPSEPLRRAYRNRKVARQRLLFPVEVEPMSGRSAPEDSQPARALLFELGFDVDGWGERNGAACRPSCSRTPTRVPCSSMPCTVWPRATSERGGRGPPTICSPPWPATVRAGPAHAMVREEAEALRTRSTPRTLLPLPAWPPGAGPDSPLGARTAFRLVPELARLIAILGPTASGKSARGSISPNA